MAKTHDVLTSPAAGTQIHPVFHHDEAQKAKLQALSEVRARSPNSPRRRETEADDACVDRADSMRTRRYFQSRIRITRGKSAG